MTGRYRTEKEATSKTLIALTERLKFRKAFLKAMATTPDPDLSPSVISGAWEVVPELLASVQASHMLGVPLRQAFTSKIPYGLASTVPPKPVIDISFDEAIATLMSICKDSQDAIFALEIEANKSPSNLLVRSLVYSGNISTYSIRVLFGLLIRENQSPSHIHARASGHS